MGKGDDVCAGAAADVNRTASFMTMDEVKKFRWTDACIPRRLPKIPVMEKEAAEQVLHVLDKCQMAGRISRRESWISVTLTIQMSSFTITQLHIKTAVSIFA
jgi:hypothetical protein